MPGGRPRKMSGRKEHVISIKLSEEELAALDEDVGESGQDRSGYIRSRLLPVVRVNDVPPAGASPKPCFVGQSADIRIGYTIEDTTLYMTHVISLGRKTAVFGLAMTDEKEGPLFRREPIRWQIDDELHGRRTLTVEEIEGKCGDQEISIIGSDVYGRCKVKLFADGRPGQIVVP